MAKSYSPIRVSLSLSPDDVEDLEGAGVVDIDAFVKEAVAQGIFRRTAVRCRACAEWVALRDVDKKGLCGGCSRWKVRRVLGFLNSGGGGMSESAPRRDKGGKAARASS